MSIPLVLVMGLVMMGGGGLGENSEPDYGGTGASTAGACYLNDAAFKDTTTVKDANYVLEKLGDKYPQLKEAEKNRHRVTQIIEASKGANINPAILISFWSGEQSFGAEYKAFGCGKFHDGEEDNGFENQLKCALPKIEKAITNTPIYDTPSGQNIWTRLLYHYIGSPELLAFYDAKKYVSDSANPRIIILQKLIPDAVTCVDKTSGTTTAGTGTQKGRGITSKPAPGIPELKVDESHRLIYKDRGTITPSMIVLHWTGGDTFESARNALETRMPEVGHLSIQIMIDKDGTAYQTMDALNEQSAGAAGANEWAINIEIVGSGESALTGNSAEINTTAKVVASLASKYSIKKVVATNSKTKNSDLLNHQGVFSHQIVDKYLNPNPTDKTDPSDQFMTLIKKKLNW